MMAPSITFTAKSWQQFQKVAEQAYPFEGCGLLLGPLQTEKTVTGVIPLKNILREEGRGRFDFSFSPQEFMQQQMAAEKMNLDVVGIYHTHPDHPPRPSKTDEGQPMLAGWVNVIASVIHNGGGSGQFKEAKAWWREDENRPFMETTLHVEAET